MGRFSVKRRDAAIAPGVVVAGVVAIWSLVGFRTVEVRYSPDRRHKAILQRCGGIDVNFRVIVDGREVFPSPDFAPVALDFREKLIWDRTGSHVVLEVAGERIFGYDASHSRDLTADELLAIEYPSFAEFRFEGELPRRGRK